MTRKSVNSISAEPVGIVISRGSRAEAEPRFFAYVWGPAPEQDEDCQTSRAA